VARTQRTKNKTETEQTETIDVMTSTTPEGRENQMIALATNLAEKQLREGTASSQVITELLKRGSAKARLEKDILRLQKELITAKTEALQAQKKSEEVYREAIDAFRVYTGNRNDQNLS
jgi:hypothetical protein